MTDKTMLYGHTTLNITLNFAFQTNEVTTDYNAGFQTAVAGLNQAFN